MVNRNKHKWSTSEKLALQQQLGKFIRLATAPGKLACLEAMSQELCLTGYHWKRIQILYPQYHLLSKEFITQSKKVIKIYNGMSSGECSLMVKKCIAVKCGSPQTRDR